MFDLEDKVPFNGGGNVMNPTQEQTVKEGPVQVPQSSPSVEGTYEKWSITRVCLTIIPAIETLEQQGMNINETCAMCNTAPRDVFHALLDCPDLQHLWGVAKFVYSSRHFHADLLEWLVIEASEWRNKKKFANEIIEVADIWPRVEKTMDEMQLVMIDDGRDVIVPTSLEWEKLEYPFQKLNVAATTSGESGDLDTTQTRRQDTPDAKQIKKNVSLPSLLVNPKHTLLSSSLVGTTALLVHPPSFLFLFSPLLVVSARRQRLLSSSRRLL
ncbi:uncharacterized protein G2W53_010614 [Senna tora]|uniref:Reverse transcriptase zinc-binding domain-containing protein n=1 Tax=Senna tora TaxID=362788 RepID=A0A835CBT7_9FABA|nr:uncharacterized protein G2W53_010614 [Senna tora]